MLQQLNNDVTTLSVESIPLLMKQRAGSELWLDETGALRWLQFGAAIEQATRTCREAGVESGDIVVTSGQSTLESLVWLFGAAAAGAIVAPLRHDRLGEVQDWKNFVEIGWHEWEGRLERVRHGTVSPVAADLINELRRRNHPGLILATGGSTGSPKIVLHDLTALLSTVPVRNGAPVRTLPLMRFDHIGGLDMAWRALAGRQILVAPPAEITPVAVAGKIERCRVEVLPATPSFLNLLMLAGVHTTHDLSSLRVVPYGAEPMPAGLLQRLRTAFPEVEFVQRFGTSETGALPVRDEGAGLVLRGEQAGYAWKVVDGELWVRSPARALGYLSGETSGFDTSGWFRTGDLAEEISDGAIRVLGRREAMINVGGEKVMPGEVEEVLLGHPLVADCRVSARASALLGQVVTAEIVWRVPEVDALSVKQALHSFAARLLPRHKLPTTVRLVSAVGTTRNLKKSRLLNA
jgi:acyl-CoA synthetase (AMP-forming)/AMP-acid ligase II